jgi:hypothetical protein
MGIVAIGAFVSAVSAIDEWMGLDHAELGLESHADWGSDPFRKSDRKVD